jgi:hypothetical protein
MNEAPHIASPFAFGPAGVSTTEQDSIEEIQDCVENIVRFRKGWREDLPDFGIPDLSFLQKPINTKPIFDAIAEYEPRAVPIIASEPETIVGWIENVLVTT